MPLSIEIEMNLFINNFWAYKLQCHLKFYTYDFPTTMKLTIVNFYIIYLICKFVKSQKQNQNFVFKKLK